MSLFIKPSFISGCQLLPGRNARNAQRNYFRARQRVDLLARKKFLCLAAMQVEACCCMENLLVLEGLQLLLKLF